MNETSRLDASCSAIWADMLSSSNTPGGLVYQSLPAASSRTTMLAVSRSIARDSPPFSATVV